MKLRSLLIVVAVCFLCAASNAASTLSQSQQVFLRRLAAVATERTNHTVRYDPVYIRILYPCGDVRADTSVCTDEVIRSYRAVGIDLQKEVHEDRVQSFSAYPRKWKWISGKPDSNIDHRRVPNLMVFSQRKGESGRIYLPIVVPCSATRNHWPSRFTNT